jgi:spore coat protein CotH
MFGLSSCKEDREVPIEEYRLVCNPDSLAYIMENPKTDHFIPVEVTFKGKTHKGRLRLRGDTSREFPKKSLKIQLLDDNGQKTSTINLNAEYLDKSYIHQHLSSLIIQENGLPCFSTSFSPVYMNDEYYGLFLQVENMDEDFLSKYGMNPKGNFYKSAHDGASLTKYDNLQEHWEKKTNESDSWYDLQDLIDEVDTVSIAGIQAFVRKHFHYDQLVKHMALNAYLSNGSTYYHNYYLYRDQLVDRRWTMIHWDLDKTLSKYDWRNLFEMGNGWQADNELIMKLFSDSTLKSDLSEELTRIDKVVKGMNLEEYIQHIEEKMATWVDMDSRDDVKDLNEWKEKLKREKQYLSETLSRRQSTLIGPMQPFWVSEGPKNRVLDPVFCWTPIAQAKENGITYEVRYSYDHEMPDKSTTIMKDISDTFFIPQGPFTEGELFYKVIARRGDDYLTGYSRFNVINVCGKANEINSLQGKVFLKKSNGPYVIRKDLELSESSELRIEAGTEVFLDNDVSIHVKGNVVVEHDSISPVIFSCASNVGGWKIIEFDHCAKPIVLNNCSFYDGRIVIRNSDLTLENCKLQLQALDLDKIAGRPSMIWGSESRFRMNNCQVFGNGTGEGMNLHGGYPVVSNSTFEHVPDAIEYISADSGLISMNVVRFSKDDAIDLNDCKNVVIEKNVLCQNRDKAISVGVDHSGKSENILIYANYICQNKTGAEIKDSSDARILDNVFMHNMFNIQVKRKEPGYFQAGKVYLDHNILLSPNETNNIVISDDGVVDFGSNYCNVPLPNVMAIDSTLFYDFKGSPFFAGKELGNIATYTASDILFFSENDGIFSITNKFYAPLDLGGCKLMNRDRICAEVPLHCMLQPGESLHLVPGKKTGTKRFTPDVKYFYYKKVEQGMDYQFLDSKGKWIFSISNHVH